MKAPKFWQTDGWRADALTPLAWIYQAISRFERFQQSQQPLKASVPIICVGNLTAGGTGKTPTVIKVVQHLVGEGVKVHVISRGYGGSAKGPLLVDVGKHAAAEVGDEPLLIACYAPTWIAKDRTGGVRAAIQAGAEIVVLDDGFQNPSVFKDLSIIVVDGGYGFGNGKCLPAGPLREPIEQGMVRADAVVLIGESVEPWPDTFHGKQVLRASFQPRFSGIALDGARVFAFAGIGRPEKFFQTVRQLGAAIVDHEAFPDHYAYTPTIIERLVKRAEAQDLTLVTTEKDFVKFPKDMLGTIWPIPVDIVFDDKKTLDSLLRVFTTKSQ